MDSLLRFATELLNVFLLSAPALLIGLFLAGLLRTFISDRVVQQYLRKPGFGSVIRAAVIGVPFPLCSCSVIPVGMALRRQGASKGATASFLVSTPEIGADSFFLSYSLLGGVLTAVRMAAAIISAIVAGGLIDLFSAEESRPDQSPASPKSDDASCCLSSEAVPPPGSSRSPSISQRVRGAFSYGFETILIDLSPYLLIGLISAAAITTFLPPGWVTGEHFGKSAGLLVFFLLSIPTYVCAASSTPIAAALLGKGVSAGAVLVFLLAGPATNLTTVAAVRGELGKKAFALYLSSVTALTLLAGWLMNCFLPDLGARAASFGHHHELLAWTSVGCGIIFGALWLRLYLPRLKRAKLRGAAPIS